MIKYKTKSGSIFGFVDGRLSMADFDWFEDGGCFDCASSIFENAKIVCDLLIS